MGRRLWTGPKGHAFPPEHFNPATRPYIVADCGSNHAGSFDAARLLIQAAAEADADAVKFQLFRWEDISTVAEHHDKKFEMPVEWLNDLKTEAHGLRLDFLCTPFGLWAVEALKEHVDAWKIGSFEALRFPLLNAAMATKKTLIVSLGMCADIEVLAVAREYRHAILLHCTSVYPTALEDSGLDRLLRMRRGPQYRRIGFSDHTADWPLAAVTAYAIGARTIERHIRLEDQPESPDRGPWALTPGEFKDYVSKLRAVAESMRKKRWMRPEAPIGRLVHGY